MIALDAGEAADFLAGASGAEANPACECVLASKGLTSKAPTAREQATEREKGPSSRRLRIRIGDRDAGRPGVRVDVSPSNLAFGLRIGRGIGAGLEGVNWRKVRAILADVVVEVSDQGDGGQVYVFVT